MALIRETTELTPAVRRVIARDQDARARIVVNNLNDVLERAVDQVIADEQYANCTAKITVTVEPEVGK